MEGESLEGCQTKKNGMASFYAGSRLLTPVGHFFALPIDQVRSVDLMENSLISSIFSAAVGVSRGRRLGLTSARRSSILLFMLVV